MISQLFIKENKIENDSSCSETDIKLDDLQACEESLKQIIKISNEIPDRVEKLTELKDKWDKIEKGVTSIRGGGEYRNSYDGVDERTPDVADEVEILR